MAQINAEIGLDAVLAGQSREDEKAAVTPPAGDVSEESEKL